jgi:polysaccharide deacetylase family protein (PEP-CTERM system associated)
MKNLLTIDVEDYFQVQVFSRRVGFQRWGAYDSRVGRNTERILEILARTGVRATFFVLGWIAERMPGLIQEIDRQGHEIASHGYRHRHIQEQTPREFREDVRSARSVIEKIIGKPVYGYRAPTYSITERSLWALRILVEEGYRYDSSIFPIRHDLYGIPSAPRTPFLISSIQVQPERLDSMRLTAIPNGAFAGMARLPSDGLLELPPATVEVLGNHFPVAGGGYFRLFPYWLTRWGLKRINREGHLFSFYIHPWELDPEQPRIQGISRLSRTRHYHNLEKTESRFLRLLSDFSFADVRSVFPWIET